MCCPLHLYAFCVKTKNAGVENHQHFAENTIVVLSKVVILYDDNSSYL